MGAEKGGTKNGGLFHLFDWNRKSRKKLFAGGTTSSEGVRKGAGVRKGTNGNDNVQTNCIHLMEDDDIVGVSSVKGSSDYSCASSVTDEEGNGIRAPGVVARLMGLDSLPTACVPEPFSTPLSNSCSLREHYYQKRSPEFRIDDQFSNMRGRSECYYRKPPEVKCQRMPSSPIERFQTEVLPPRSAKSLPITHYKLLSPIKNPRFLSGKNAAHIMEAAAKILEPGLHVNAKDKAPVLGSSSHTVKDQDPKQNIAVSQRPPRLPESSRQPLDSSAIKYLKGHSLNKSWNGPESSNTRPSPQWEEPNSTGAKSREKSVSLAIQAKVNVQKREGLTTPRNVPVPRQQDEAKQNQSFKNQVSSKTTVQKKSSAAGSSGVLRQNNQKQNCLSAKDKSTAKPLVSNQQVRKVHSGDASSGKQRNVNKMLGNSKVGSKKEELQATDHEKDVFASKTKDAPRKKRLIDGNYQSDRNGISDTISFDRHEKRLQSSVMIDEHQKSDDDSRRNGTDVVSFTFTSPMIKPQPGSHSSYIMEKHDMSSFSIGLHGERNDADLKSRKLSSLGLNMTGGDALSILLEQKLKELTSGFESYSNLMKMGNMSVPTSFIPGTISASENSRTVPMLHDKETVPESHRASSRDESDASLLPNGRPYNLSSHLQGVEGMADCSTSTCSDAHKRSEQQHPSPLSILEASFSNESCNSSDSSDSTTDAAGGSKTCTSSSVQAQNDASPGDERPQSEQETDISDSASSSYMGTVCESHGAEIVMVTMATGPAETRRRESEYVRDILRAAAGIDPEALTLCPPHHQALDPLLFDRLENSKRRRSSSSSSSGRCRTKGGEGNWRRVLFDCVGECLESRRGRYFQAGYRSWVKGSSSATARRADELADEVYREISEWKGMGDWMVDELVDKDMSTGPGRWVDFEVEAFEAGVEVATELLSSLVDEIVADLI